MAKQKRNKTDENIESEVGLTIDELAAESGVPSRTIRYYQSKGALAKPRIQGRVAFYGEAHRERLQLIAQLQDRGLSIKAIRELVTQLDQGKLSISDWLGLEEQLKQPWVDETSQLLNREQLYELAGSSRRGLLGDLERNHLVERKGDHFYVESPRLLKIAMALEGSKISLDAASDGAAIIREHMRGMAKELIKLYMELFGDEFSGEDVAENLGKAMASLRPMSQEAVQIIFSRTIEETLKEFVASGKLVGLHHRKERRGRTGRN